MLSSKHYRRKIDEIGTFKYIDMHLLADINIDIV
jgi:hypothetical protein